MENGLSKLEPCSGVSAKNVLQSWEQRAHEIVIGEEDHKLLPVQPQPWANQRGRIQFC